MSAATGIIGGALALASLQLVLSSDRATSAFGKLATVPAGWIEKIMDSSVPAIPDHSITAPPDWSSSAAPSSAQLPAFSSLPPISTPSTLSV